jgi:DNA-binding NarL/FixJ family response regulator
MGAVSYDIQASSRRLESAFHMHTEEGVAAFLEKLYQLDELKYFAGDYDISIWIVDFYEAIRKCGLSHAEERVIFFLYFEGYKTIEVAAMLKLKKNTVSTYKKRAIAKLVRYYESLQEVGGSN